MDIRTIPFCKILPNCLVVYDYHVERRYKSEKQLENEKNLRDQTYNGYMSLKTKSKVRKMLDAWFTSVEVQRRKLNQGRKWRNSKITFVTLTLSAKQRHTDHQIKRELLMPYLETLKRKFAVQNYFWRAEAQKNGNIHFHVLIDTYIHWRTVRDEWNKTQARLGYIDEFEMKYNHRDPNSTDIHGLDKTTNCTAYVVKYCCKTDGYRKIEGRIWGCSDKLRNIRNFETEVDSQVNDYIQAVLKENGEKTIQKDSCTIIPINNMRYLNKLSPALFNRFEEYHLKTFRDLYTRNEIPIPLKKEVRKRIEPEKKPEYVQMSFMELVEVAHSGFGRRF